MIGQGVLLECLDEARITEVLVIVRRELQLNHPKLKQLIHSDFSEFKSVSEQLDGYDACFACMGVSSAGLSEAEYRLKTYDYTMALATVLVEQNPSMTFNYVSGQGTDGSEQGRSMWARVKGKTENDLMNLGFKQSFMFRPGGIIPKRGVKSRTPMYQFFITTFGWLLHVIHWISPNSITDTERIGKAMIQSHLQGFPKQILTPKDINTLAQSVVAD